MYSNYFSSLAYTIGGLTLILGLLILGRWLLNAILEKRFHRPKIGRKFGVIGLSLVFLGATQIIFWGTDLLLTQRLPIVIGLLASLVFLLISLSERLCEELQFRSAVVAFFVLLATGIFAYSIAH